MDNYPFKWGGGILGITKDNIKNEKPFLSDCVYLLHGLMEKNVVFF